MRVPYGPIAVLKRTWVGWKLNMATITDESNERAQGRRRSPPPSLHHAVKATCSASRGARFAWVHLLALAAFFCCGCGVEAAEDVRVLPHFPAVARQVVTILQRGHILQQPFDDSASARTWTNLLAFLDYDRVYFLQEDIAHFEPLRYQLDDALKNGDLTFAYDVFDVFRDRLSQRMVFMTNFLATPIDFSVDESYQWRRKKASWPATQEEQNDLWRRRLKNDYLGFTISRELAAKDQGTNTPLSTATALGSATNLLAQTPEQFVTRRYTQFKMVIDDADSDWVFQRYMSAVAAAYDPHSDYLSPEKREDFDIEMNLSLSGIGATLRPEDGTALVVDLIPGGPAARDTRDIRLRPNDKIIGVGQDDGPIEDILHLPLSKTVRKIRGKKGTKVVLLVISAADPTGASTRLLDLVRDDVKLEEQAATGRVERVTLADGNDRVLGVVTLPMFYGSMQRPGTPGFRSCALDVAREIARLNDEKIEGLVLDLRNNGGGSLREAVHLAALFLNGGPVVQVREAWQVQVLNMPLAGGPAFRKPMVVLVNRASASASEIVAGALQDYGRAIIIGDSKTHGKGSVQSVLPLSGTQAGSIKLTSANYYRVTGASTQLRGVVPDVVIPSLLDAMEIGEDQLTNPLPWSRVAAAEFTPVFDLQPWLAEIKPRVAERLATSEHYRNYSRLVQHLAELTQNTSVSLEYTARREMARAEREMRKIQEEEEESISDEKDKKDDLILDAALMVLSDFVDVSQGAEIPQRPPANELRTLMLRVFGKE